MRIARKVVTVPFSRPEKAILTQLAIKSGLSYSALIRQLVIREHQAPRHEKALATLEAR